MIKFFILGLLCIKYIISLTFDLDEQHTQRCILLRGDNVGKELKLEY